MSAGQSPTVSEPKEVALGENPVPSTVTIWPSVSPAEGVTVMLGAS